MNETICEISGVKKLYGQYEALKGIDLKVEKGEFIAIVGPSGSGKSTLLQIISGFEDLSEGALRIDGVDMGNVAPSQRPTSMVFQKLALFPHKTVADNIGFPLKLRKVAKDEIDRRIGEMIDLMELKPEYLGRYPGQLSGGEQQRVALARSMIQQPKLLLLDEPLSALDAKLKKVLQAELKRLHRNVGMTFIHVTHDLEEAMMLADHICVMNGGRMMQIGRADDIYYRPANRFVAEFIGETNFVPVEIDSVDGAGRIAYHTLGDMTFAGVVQDPDHGGRYAAGDRTQLMIRPEFIELADPADHGPSIDAIVEETFMRGATVQIKARAARGDADFIIELAGYRGSHLQIGQRLRLGWKEEHGYLLPPEGEREA